MAFLGTGDFGRPALCALRDAGHEVVVAVSQPDRPAGRGRKLRPSAIHAQADELGVPHVQAEDINALSPQEVAPGAEIGVVVAFGQKIGAAWLDAFPHGLINIHASLLPRYRGAAPYQWAVINGDTTTGVTVFRLNERWDAGPLLGQRETPIGELETADELHDRLALLGAELIVQVVRELETGAARPLPQDASGATRAPKLTRRDRVIDFTQPARVVQRRI
ncbi:MAG: methionyl-tRNA formyltransferase, partial [Planctomycetota bacterium]